MDKGKFLQYKEGGVTMLRGLVEVLCAFFRGALKNR